MRLNGRGESGFLDAIIAIMIVSASLTAFLGYLAYAGSGNVEEGPEPDTGFLSGFSISDDRIDGDAGFELGSFMERHDLNGIRLNMYVAGDRDISFGQSVGDCSGNNVGCKKGTLPLDTDDGRTLVVSFEVIYWWD